MSDWHSLKIEAEDLHYIVIEDEAETFEFMYVGQSRNIKERLKGNHVAKQYSLFCVQVEDLDKRLQVEKLLIQTINPKLNIALKRRD